MPLDLQRLVGPLKIEGTETEPLYVIVQGISVITYNKVGGVLNVPPNSKTTLLTQMYVAGTFENVVMVSVSGTGYAKFFLTINGVDTDVRRTGPDRNLTFDFTGAPIALSIGDIVDVKVQHFDNGKFYDFEATIYGYSG